MDQIIIDASSLNEITELSKVYKEIRKKDTSSSLVSFDFDDTLNDNTDIFNNRIKVFKNLVSSDKIYSFIITSRNTIEKIKEIAEFCINHQIDSLFPYIIYNIEDKSVILDLLQVDMHFEDNLYTTIKTTSKKIPVMFMGEFLNCDIVKIWKDKLEEKKILDYYTIDKKYNYLL